MPILPSCSSACASVPDSCSCFFSARASLSFSLDASALACAPYSSYSGADGRPSRSGSRKQGREAKIEPGILWSMGAQTRLANTYLLGRHLVLLLLCLETNQLCLEAPATAHRVVEAAPSHRVLRQAKAPRQHSRPYPHTDTRLSSSSFCERISLICSRSLSTSVSASMRACPATADSIINRPCECGLFQGSWGRGLAHARRRPPASAMGFPLRPPQSCPCTLCAQALGSPP